VAESNPEPSLALDRQQLILEAARDVIAEVAPQELPLVTPISTAYFANPEDTLRRRRSKDKPLGFGVPAEATQLLTPIALAVTTQVVSFLAEAIGKSIKAEAPDVINDVVKSLFRKLRRTQAVASPSATTAQPQSQASLTPAQLRQVREIAVQKARQLGLTAGKAELLADSLVGGLAVTS
jgi:hypothetical protein